MGYLRPGQEALFIVLYLLSCIFLAASYVAWVTNPLDLAPAYAGLIASVCEIGAMWLAIVVPIIVEQITVDKSREQWLLVLYITGGLQLGTFLIYLAFGSSKLQSWARPEGRRKVSVGHPQEGNGAHSGEVAPTEAKVEVRASPWRPRSPSYMSDSEVGLLLYRPLTLGQPRPKSTPCGAVKRGSESGLDDISDEDRTSAYGSLEVTI
ncbi:hypothetical protein C0Q70_02335 [Pomacea canaliculata]|uniref:Major facilitator superfamily (MFS) profile domain-containing protein n=2 Tax=Pomacea canaliculata TaxID=400727 RepID=A0A2T7PPL7_POMCA|nr:hypothetical protein C0Q70_02335 [Pomacea canaliculata]